ncbi:WcaI family glycosyltransferase [Psychromonas sp. PT13]|uniref:WcaI family glycosyltransferase n=1 Tax=Psychromonas sp. PT13 TaxID=3439547 RepID=UPI003EC13C83
MYFILHSLNYSPELTGIGKYNGEMAVGLVERDVKVSAFLAPPYYPEWKIHDGFQKFTYHKSIVDGVKIIRCPLYVPKKVTTIKRIIHLSSFAFSSGLALFSKMFKKPDIIMLVQPTLFCAPFTLLFAKLTGAKAIMHIQDYEVDALFGLGMMGEGRVAKIVKYFEKWLLSRFDAVSTISYSMIENAKDKGFNPEKIILFPNWSDTEFVTPHTCGSSIREEWGFDAKDIIVLYAGNIGNKQGLEMVVEAAKQYTQQQNIKFVFVGTGAYVDTLKSMAESSGLLNVYFKPLQPWAKVPAMLAAADIHLVIQRKGAADAVLPSKLTNILSVGGHALVTAEDHTELGKTAVKHPGIFTCVEPENVTSFVNGLNSLLDQVGRSYNVVARDFAEKYLSKDKVIDKFLTDLNELVGAKHDIQLKSDTKKELKKEVGSI